MNKIATSVGIGIVAVALAVVGVVYAGDNAKASPQLVTDAAVGDAFKATAVRDIGNTDSLVVGLSLPAGSYTVTGSSYMIFADKGNCFLGLPGASVSMATPRVSGYNEASLSATGAVTLTAPNTVELRCSSEKILPPPQSPAANGTIIATRVGVLNDQGHGIT